jgi:DNA-binding LacI/PurR family transcriptional regulator
MAKSSKTMKQIAAELGVSRTTVSLVLQGKGDEYRISRDTQETIRSFVEESEYKPNYFAKALNRGRSDIIGAVFPDVFESFMGNIIRGIESVLYEEGYSLMISTSRFDNRRERLIVEKMVWQGVDGIILVPTMPFRGEGTYEGEHVKRLLEEKYPLVIVDRNIEGLVSHTVLQDDFEAAWRAVSGVIGEGARSIACLSFDIAASSINQRLSAYRQALKEAGLKERSIILDRLDPESDDLEKAVTRLLSEGISPDAWFVTTSGLADKLAWLLEKTEAKPAIIRFGETPPWNKPRMRDIPHPHREMGRAAAELLLELIEKPDTACRHITCVSGN